MKLYGKNQYSPYQLVSRISSINSRWNISKTCNLQPPFLDRWLSNDLDWIFGPAEFWQWCLCSVLCWWVWAVGRLFFCFCCEVWRFFEWKRVTNMKKHLYIILTYILYIYIYKFLLIQRERERESVCVSLLWGYIEDILFMIGRLRIFWGSGHSKTPARCI